ncbi:MAG: GNAT family N-acetyltransferase [Solirubrobacteraceae bacterium]|jgi:GNAT superfamily N-acetyltransferase
MDLDGASSALVETWERMVSVVPGGWSRSADGVVAAVTGVPLPTLNGVWVGSVQADPRVVADLLDRVNATGLPYCLQARPDAAHLLTDLVAMRGMAVADDIPLMVIDEPDALRPLPATDGLAIRVLAAAEADQHARVAAAGFEAPVEPFLQLMTPEVLDLPGLRCYVGDLDDEPATTGLGVTIGSYVALFNIATPPSHRRRGLAAALTARAVKDGFESGATWSWLQSSEAGYTLYERLGFRTVARWPCWLHPATNP